MNRRTFLAAATAFAAAPTPTVHLGILQFGTVQWVADIIRRHDLDTKHGFALQTTTLANTDAGRVSLMARASDIVLSDWPFVAVQRANGTNLSFAAFSSSSGGVMTPPASSIRTLADLRDRKIGIAGGPADKSWLILQAAAHLQGIDLATQTHPVYGAPPLLGAKLQQGELDAVLTYWNFAAKLEAAGFREAIPVAGCVTALGISPRISMIGFVFREDWAQENRSAIDGFLAAVNDAENLLKGSDAEWNAIRPLMDSPDDALFARLRDRFEDGLNCASTGEQLRGATRLLAVLKEVGGTQATGGINTLPQNVFWPEKHVQD
jgi:NitT/TauT family transport system substrate-binding protein